MLELAALLCLLGALALLVILSVIDLREGLLPNEFVLGLAVAGLIFHLCLLFHYLDIVGMGLGAFIGGGILYAIRLAANYVYEDDALGLGDVKLLAAGGVWLGPEGILIGMTLGALAGFLHGLAVMIYATRKAGVKSKFSTFSIPAGPGFALGLVAAALYQFRDFPAILF